MAIQILPGNSIGSNLGQALGSGIQQALQGLVQQKIQQKYRMQAIPGLEGLGFSPEQAQSIALLDPQIQREVVKQRMAAPQQEAYAQALQGLLGEGQQMPQLGAPAMQQFSGQAPQLPLGQQMGMMPQAMQQQSQAFRLPPRLTQQQATELAKLQLQKQAQQEKQRQFETKLSAQEQRETNKETLPAVEEINKKAEAARNNIQRLSRMQELINRGELPYAAIESVFEGVSEIPFVGEALSKILGAVRKPFSGADAEEFRKLSKDFISNIKDIFPGRILDSELKAFLETIPTLLQSDAGKAAVINNLMRFNEGILIKEKAMEEIISENQGKRPRDLNSLIKKRTKKALDDLAKDFKEDGKRYFRPAYKSRPRLQSKIEKNIHPGARKIVLESIASDPGLANSDLGKELQRQIELESQIKNPLLEGLL